MNLKLYFLSLLSFVILLLGCCFLFFFSGAGGRGFANFLAKTVSFENFCLQFVYRQKQNGTSSLASEAISVALICSYIK